MLIHRRVQKVFNNLSLHLKCENVFLFKKKFYSNSSETFQVLSNFISIITISGLLSRKLTKFMIPPKVIQTFDFK